MITRREFMRALGFGALELSLPGVAPRFQQSQVYEAAAFGLRFALPAGWRFVSAPEIDESRRAARLPGGEEAKRAVFELAGYPLVIATRDRAATRGPMVVLWRQEAHCSHHDENDSVGFSFVHHIKLIRYRVVRTWIPGFDQGAVGKS